MDADKVADNTKRRGPVWAGAVNHHKIKMAVSWFRKKKQQRNGDETSSWHGDVVSVVVVVAVLAVVWRV